MGTRLTRACRYITHTPERGQKAESRILDSSIPMKIMEMYGGSAFWIRPGGWVGAPSRVSWAILGVHVEL